MNLSIRRTEPASTAPPPSLAPSTPAWRRPRLDHDTGLAARPTTSDGARPRTAGLLLAQRPAASPPTPASSRRDELATMPSWRRAEPAGPQPTGNQSLIARFEKGRADALNVLKQTTSSIKQAPNAELALAQLTRLREAAKWSPELQPNSYVVAATISALGRHGELDSALEVFQQARDEGPQPDVHVYGALFGAHQRNGAADRTGELVRDGMKAGVFQADLGRDAVGNRIDFHAQQLLEPEHHVEGERGVPPTVAQAAFEHHFEQGHVRPGTVLIVGRGEGQTKKLISDLLDKRGLRGLERHLPGGFYNAGRLDVVEAGPSARPAAPSPARR